MTLALRDDGIVELDTAATRAWRAPGHAAGVQPQQGAAASYCELLAETCSHRERPLLSSSWWQHRRVAANLCCELVHPGLLVTQPGAPFCVAIEALSAGTQILVRARRGVSRYLECAAAGCNVETASLEGFSEYQSQDGSWPRIQAGFKLEERASTKLQASEDVESGLEIEVAEINVPALALLPLKALVQKGEAWAGAHVYRPIPLTRRNWQPINCFEVERN